MKLGSLFWEACKFWFYIKITNSTRTTKTRKNHNFQQPHQVWLPWIKLWFSFRRFFSPESEQKHISCAQTIRSNTTENLDSTNLNLNSQIDNIFSDITNANSLSWSWFPLLKWFWFTSPNKQLLLLCANTWIDFILNSNTLYIHNFA